MKEIDFYPEICEKFSNYLLTYLPEYSVIKYSYNKSLPQMISEIEEKFNITEQEKANYIPKLKLDILFGIKLKESKKITYILLEVKYLNQLGLSEYSQLSGYLQVAQKIKLGVLFLVMKPKSNSALSNDFNEIIKTHNLPMKWKMLIDNELNTRQLDFKTGISYYVPNNGIEWINTVDIDGISSFEKLANEIANA
ncbi:MAG: hypothetical protein B6D64_05625 [Bacteroidetes bacterium 4484_276]|nr:MAG: hypothetical protein B6D64_05625 [Bacteroidetes bacterium 4484_276]